jgi:type II secretory pathway pseudopilin PulG
MRLRHTGILTAALAPCAALALAAPLPAQYQPPPGPQASPALPGTRTQVSTYQGQPAQQGFIPTPPPPPPPYYPYGNNAVDPYGGYMQGAASIINAQANFTQARQQAAIIKEQARQARLDTQRKIFDEWQYETANTPTWTQTQEKQRQEALGGVLSQANPAEVSSGWALNVLLTDIQKLQAMSGLAGPHVPVDPQAVARINFSAAGSNPAGVGMFKSAKLQWPDCLLGDRFAADRQEVDRLAAEATRNASTGSGSPTTANDLDKAVRKLRADLKDSVNDVPAADYIDALEFMKTLDSSVQALRQPTAARLLGGELSASGRTVDELVASMTRQGLQFAPAVPGNEGYYSSLYQSLRAYDFGLGRVASR